MMTSHALTALIGTAALASTVLAQPAITWYTIDGGGGTSGGGGYTLSGTIGQPDAGAAMTGGSYTLVGGFWPGVGSCRADWNEDGLVNSNDISTFLTAWLGSLQMGNLAADFNGDQAVNSNDISAFLTAWLAALQSGC